MNVQKLTQDPHAGPAVKVCRVLIGLLRTAALLLAVWCAGAIWYFRDLASLTQQIVFTAIFTVAATGLLLFSFRRRWLLVPSLLLSLLVMTGWFFLQHATGDRNWAKPFRRMPVITFSKDGRSVTIDGVRDFHYRSERDFDVRYHKWSYRFDDLETLDYSVTYWNGNRLFGHIMLVFGFRDGRKLVFSPEARLEGEELYEVIPGMYRKYELIFLFTTEEDSFMLRTHHRRYEKEAVYLYPTNTQKEVIVYLFRDLLRRADLLRTRPEFYNGFTYNCLSTMAPTAEKLGFDFCSGLRGTFNGVSDRTGYDKGWLKRTQADEPFEEYKKRHYVNQYVEHLTNPPDYSRLMRPELHP